MANILSKLKTSLSKPFASFIVQQQQSWINNPVYTQEKVLKKLINKAMHTSFGRAHQFDSIRSFDDFKKNVPVRDYEGLRTYIDHTVAGKSDVLWPGVPLYFAKTSGTTSGTKFIPITKASIPYHINSARNALLSYIYDQNKPEFINGKMIFLSGSPVMNRTNGILTGRLSGIVNHHVPQYLRTNQLPTYETNCMEDWEEKVDKIVEETMYQDMTLISGIPPWVQMYFDRLMDKSGKPIGELFPNLQLMVHGGVNFKPYKRKLFESIGREVDAIETYPASEGFFAYQDRQSAQDLLLLLNNGMYYEFIPMDEFHDEHPRRLRLDEVKEGVNYALIINSNAGLWGYSIGDTIKFTSINPYRIVVTGRTKHFISAFGEHVIAEEVEKAMNAALEQFPSIRIVEFTVAPQVTPHTGLPLHEWFVEFEHQPIDLNAFEQAIDTALCQLNSYYDDLITGSVLRKLVIVPLRSDAFKDYMKSKGKLGGQNKVPRLSNNRKIADELLHFSRQ